MASTQPVFITPKSEPIDIGRRLREIFAQRKLSLRAFASYYGSSKDVIHRIMTGDRLPMKTELVNIAQHLKMTYERLMMVDTQSELEELVRLVKNKSNPKRAIQLATDLLDVSIGYTERFYILNYLGAAHHQLNQHEKAHNIWMQALPYAEKISAMFDDTEELYKITSNLILSHTVRKDVLRLALLLEQVEPGFANSDPKRAGYIMYYRARLALDHGDLELFLNQMYRVDELYQMTGDVRLQDTGKNNIAFAEYLAGNLHKAEALYVQIVESPSQFNDLKYLARKGYGQTLLKVKKRTAANVLIEKSLHELEQLDLPDLQAHFLLLRAYSQNDMESAKRVLDLQDVEEDFYFLAYKCLMEHCERVQDSEGFLKYHQLARRYSKDTPFHEEVLRI